MPKPADNPIPIPLADVAQHNSSASCWVAIEGSVYDITQFVSQHPGGSVILKACGTEASELFRTQDNIGPGHSDDARAILAEYQIGTLET